MSNPQTSHSFGNGEVGGSAPVYGTTANGDPVTVSFGQGSRTGHTGIASGHVSGSQHYGTGGHDHYGPNGESFAVRGAYNS